MDYFKIDETPALLLAENGGIINTTPVLKDPYNLLNLETYDAKGENIVKEAGEENYKYHFIKRLQGTEFLEDEIKFVDFIDYHYQNSKDKVKYVKVLQYRILREWAAPDGYWFTEILKEWIREKRITLGLDEDKNQVSVQKIKWNGTQKNLAELFLELEAKGWVEKIEIGQRASICKSIVAIFDISETKRSKDTDSLKSFKEIMTPFIDDRTKETSYPKVFSERYKKQFEHIKPAKKTT